MSFCDRMRGKKMKLKEAELTDSVRLSVGLCLGIGLKTRDVGKYSFIFSQSLRYVLLHIVSYFSRSLFRMREKMEQGLIWTSGHVWLCQEQWFFFFFFLPRHSKAWSIHRHLIAASYRCVEPKTEALYFECPLVYLFPTPGILFTIRKMNRWSLRDHPWSNTLGPQGQNEFYSFLKAGT